MFHILVIDDDMNTRKADAGGAFGGGVLRADR